MAVAEREHVVGNVATTLHAESVVAGVCLRIEVASPVGVVVVLVVPVVGGVGIEELVGLLACACALEQ